MKNERMEEMIKKGLAVDLSKCEMAFNDQWYVISDERVLARLKKNIETDFCDSKTEQWIWSIGRLPKDLGDYKAGMVLASTTAVFYDNPHFECLWLR